MPGLVVVAGLRGGAVRVAEHEAVPPRVGEQPLAGGSLGREIWHVPGIRAARRREIDRQTQLVLGVARPRGVGQRAPEALLVHPVGERVDLGPVVAIARGNVERSAGGRSRRGHVRKLGNHDRADLLVARNAGSVGAHEVVRHVVARNREVRVHQGESPIRLLDKRGLHVAEGAHGQRLMVGHVRLPGCRRARLGRGGLGLGGTGGGGNRRDGGDPCGRFGHNSRSGGNRGRGRGAHRGATGGAGDRGRQDHDRPQSGQSPDAHCSPI